MPMEGESIHINKAMSDFMNNTSLQAEHIMRQGLDIILTDAQIGCCRHNGAFDQVCWLTKVLPDPFRSSASKTFVAQIRANSSALAADAVTGHALILGIQSFSSGDLLGVRRQRFGS